MTNQISTFIADNFFWGLIAVLALNLFQRKYKEAAKKKRQATLFLAIFVFALYSYAILIVQLKLHDAYLLIFLVIAAVVMYMLRKHVLPFRFKCVSCGTRLDPKDIVFNDSNTCEKCREKFEPPHVVAEEENETEKTESDD
jgi:hypothetical protein